MNRGWMCRCFALFCFVIQMQKRNEEDGISKDQSTSGGDASVKEPDANLQASGNHGENVSQEVSLTHPSLLTDSTLPSASKYLPRVATPRFKPPSPLSTLLTFPRASRKSRQEAPRAVLDVAGVVYTAGSNSYGQLGREFAAPGVPTSRRFSARAV